MTQQHALERVSRHVAQAMNDWRIATGAPGISAALITGDAEPLVLVDGMASLQPRRAVRDGHRFHFGSITKSFTALVSMKLAESGALDLEAPIDTYLPWFRPRSESEPVRVRHLLTHQAGLPIGADLSGTTPFDVWLLRSAPTAWEPGAGYSYSNAGYAAVGAALEAVSGKRYGDIVREVIFDPLGMDASSPAIDQASRPLEAIGHRRRVETDLSLGDVGVAPWVCVTSAEGGAVGTAGDLGRYVRMLILRGRTPEGSRLLKPASFRRMTSRQARIDRRRWYAFGLRTYLLDGRRVIEHGGEMLGMRASMVADLEAGVGAVALVNLVDTTPLALTEHMIRALRSAMDGMPSPGFHPPPVQQPLRLPVSPAEETPRALRRYMGRYASTSPWRRPLAMVHGDRPILRIAGEPDAELFPAGSHGFWVGSEKGPEVVKFDAFVDERALRLSLSGHPYLREERFDVSP
jgi:CubicO group peptidase (beta-lactamase class C family)